MKTTAAVMEGQMTFGMLLSGCNDNEAGNPKAEIKNETRPENVLDIKWEHPEYGSYYIRPADAPHGDFECLYYDMLTKLIRRKYEELFFGGPYPEMQRVELLDDKDLGENPQFAPVQGILIKMVKNPWNAMFIRPGRLEASLEKNKCMCLKLDEQTYVISPFFEWELAEFWEGGLYELD